MPCYRPLHGFKSRNLNPSGKRSIVFNISEGYRDLPIQIPCGQCLGCRLERSRQWAIRCMHEASLHENNCFITLTYSPEHLPEGGNLIYDHFQRFMKRLRKKFSNTTIRYYMCAEYGEKFKRPHFHACLFNLDFVDKVPAPMRRRPGEQPLFVSDTLNSLWPYGFASIGQVTFESAAYVARYITKKQTGQKSWEHYTDFDANTGEIFNERVPEFNKMSLKPGIGAGWFDKYKTDVYPLDEIIIRERQMKPPKFYDKLLERHAPKIFHKIKAKRKAVAKIISPDNTEARLRTRELKKELDTKKLIRSYENET